MGITTVIWANGYGFDYSWINLPVLDDWGYPVQHRGVSRFPARVHLLLKAISRRSWSD